MDSLELEHLFTTDLQTHSTPLLILLSQALELKFLHSRMAQWDTDKTPKDFAELLDIALASKVTDHAGSDYIAFRHNENCLCSLYFSYGSVNVSIFASTSVVAEAAIEELRVLIPRAEPKKEHLVSMNFWSLGSQGPVSMRRNIACPSWEEIDDNYPNSILDSLNGLMRLDNGAFFRAAQLILWQGMPGTGKTYALRALTRSWKKWCAFHYITDPEAFFMKSSEYMMNVLLQQQADIDPDEEDDSGKLWNLLILEDAGEILAADARQQVGQGLSRLLNIVDGLIGQGLRLIILVTTNEELKTLHPAVTRYGRCAAQVQFPKFTKDEAQGWLEQHQIDYKVQGSVTLAELFAIASGKDVKQVEVGFAAGKE